MVEINNLTKYYGKNLALDNVSFHLNEGDILGFLGPNGAGKSTTMNIITGYLSQDEGSVTIDGIDMLKNPKKAKSKIGYLPEQPPLYLDMTVKDYLNFVYDLKKVKLDKKSHIDEVCDMVMISDVKNRLIKNLSKGYKQRVGLAQALIGYPKVLILDEPTVGLDPKQIIEIRNLIKKLSEKHSIILSSHVLSEIQAICNRVVVINKGKIIADDETLNLSKMNSTVSKYNASIKGDKDKIQEVLSSISGVNKVECIGSEQDDVHIFDIECDSNIDIRQSIFLKLVDINSPLLGLNKVDASLEDIFVELTDKNIDAIFSDSNDEDLSSQDEENVTEDTVINKEEQKPRINSEDNDNENGGSN